MSILRTLIDFCVIKQSLKTKDTVADIVCNILVVKKFWQNIESFV